MSQRKLALFAMSNMQLTESWFKTGHTIPLQQVYFCDVGYESEECINNYRYLFLKFPGGKKLS